MQSPSLTGFGGSQIRQDHEKLFHNAWIATVYGRTEASGDIAIADLARVERQVAPFGALVLLAESVGTNMELGRSYSKYIEPTDEQHRHIGELAALANGDMTIPHDLIETAREHLPALFSAHLAVTEGHLYFNGGQAGRYEEKFAKLLSKPIGNLTEEAQELWQRAHELTPICHAPSVFVIEVARASQQAQVV